MYYNYSEESSSSEELDRFGMITKSVKTIR